MKRKIAVLLVVFVLIFSMMPVYAAGDHKNIEASVSDKQDEVSKPVIFQKSITVGKDGGTFNVGFATIKFPKNFISDESLPIVLNIEISSVNGVPGIEFLPDVPVFNKDVVIFVDSYQGLIYDKTMKQNIFVKIKNQVLKAEHFSRYAFS